MNEAPDAIVASVPVGQQEAQDGGLLADELLLRAAERSVQYFVRVTFVLVLPAGLGFLGALLALALGQAFMPVVASVMLAAVVCYGTALWLLRPHMSGRTVLWIRRFHQGERSRHLQVLMGAATGATGNFITLADDDVTSESENPQAARGYFAVIVAVIFPAMLYLEGDPLWILGPAVGPLWYVVQRGLAALARRRVLTSRNMERKLGRALRAARWHVGESVFRCPKQGELWMDAIRYLARRVDAVVIFADESSPDLNREIELLLATGGLSPRNMVLIHSAPSPGVVMQHPALADAWSFQLPAQLSSWWPYNSTGLALSYLIRAAANRNVSRRVESF